MFVLLLLLQKSVELYMKEYQWTRWHDGSLNNVADVAQTALNSTGNGMHRQAHACIQCLAGLTVNAAQRA